MKTIYAIFQQHRVADAKKPWSNGDLLFCETEEKAAKEDCKKLNEMRPKGEYLEFNYFYESRQLFTKPRTTKRREV